MSSFKIHPTKLAAVVTLLAGLFATVPSHAESKAADKQCADVPAGALHHAPHRAPSHHTARRKPDELQGISQHYVQAAEEHLGHGELDVLESGEYRSWSLRYDAAAQAQVCANKPPIDANTHLLRGCLRRFYHAQLID